jgi:CheY-like chemotaxis protein
MPQPASLGDQRVLVVEDDEDIRSFVTAVLEDAGYHVLPAANGLEALQRVEQESPGAILLDMKMPVMDGWAFVAQYRANSPRQAPIIVMTAAHEAAERAREVNATDVLSKPFDIDDLLASLSRALEHHR